MNGTLLALLAALGVIVYYASACWLWPYATCGRCKGKGKRRALWGGNAFRLCGSCSGSGRQLRFGRRVYNFLRAKKKGAS